MKTGITINGQPVHVPSSWNELTHGQSLQLEGANNTLTMHILTGIDLEVCKQVRPELIEAILYPATVMGEPELIDDPLILGKQVPRKVGSMEFARKINCDALTNGPDAVGRMVAIYCADGIEDEDIEATYNQLLDESFTNVISAGRIISDQLTELKKGEERIKQPEYEGEEFQAGISEFKKYGVWGLVRGIALRHHCTMEDVYKWSYNSVLLELQYSADENAYQRKLNRILNNKNKK